MGYFSQMTIDEWLNDRSQVDIPDTPCEKKSRKKKKKSKLDPLTKKAHYSYSGPVYIYDHKVCDYWVGYTTAKSKSEAARNLAYRFKEEHKWPIRSKLIFPNEIVLEE